MPGGGGGDDLAGGGMSVLSPAGCLFGVVAGLAQSLTVVGGGGTALVDGLDVVGSASPALMRVRAVSAGMTTGATPGAWIVAASWPPASAVAGRVMFTPTGTVTSPVTGSRSRVRRSTIVSAMTCPLDRGSPPARAVSAARVSAA